MKKAAKLIVQGTVQGIFYRQFIKEHAESLKLTGYVRNLEDGNVEIIAEGEPEHINKLAQLAKEGPKHAQIRNVNTTERKWSGEFKTFKILKF